MRASSFTKTRRWLSFVAIATQNAIASILINGGSHLLGGSGNVEPLSIDMWLDGGGGVSER